jgi:transposase
MLSRHAISDADWERIRDLLPGRPGQPGWTAKDNRLFVDAVLWVAKTGAPWRDLPERFGKWNSVWKRFDRWACKGVWQQVFSVLQDPDLEWLILDSTVVRAHQHAAGARKKTAAQRLKLLAVAAADIAPRCMEQSRAWACRPRSS